MKNKKISLYYDPQVASLKSQKRRKWFFLFWSLILLSQIIIVIYRINDLENNFDIGDIVVTCLNLLLPLLFLVNVIYSSRANRQLFVVFAHDEIRYRDQPGIKVTKIQLKELCSVEQYTFGAYLHLQDGQKHHLSWESADYDDIQEIKQNLQRLQHRLKSRQSSA